MIDFLIKSIKKLTSWSFEAVSLANASDDMKMSPQGVPYPTNSANASSTTSTITIHIITTTTTRVGDALVTRFHVI